MVTAINHSMAIQGLGVGKNQNIKCLSYADDLTLTLRGKRSVGKAFELIENFAKASGLKLNKQNTNGLKIKNCNNRNAGLPLNQLGEQNNQSTGHTNWHDKFQINLARSNRKNT